MAKRKEPRKRKLPKNVREQDGRYTYRYDVYEVVDGKSKRRQKETPSYRTPREAEEAGILIKAQQIQGTFIDEKNMTFCDWADQWMEMYEERTDKKNSIATHKNRIEQLKKIFGGFRLKDITALQYQKYLYQLKKDGKSKNTILGRHSTMGMIFKKASKPPFKFIKNDITKDVELPSFAPTFEELEKMDEQEEYLEKEQLNLFINRAYEIAENRETEKEMLIARQCARALHVLAYSGLRIGELCALDKGSIDEINKSIRITKTLYVQEGIEKYALNTPKNGSARTVGVTDIVTDLLKEQAVEKKKLMLMSETYYKGRDFIFANAKRKPGYPLSPLEIARYMTEVLDSLKEYDLPSDLSPHNLRHTYTSLSAEAGIELASIQHQLGHTNDKITTKIYMHVTKGRRVTNMEKLDRLLSSIN
ncbi:tyrosine-type recombinase/integrase [Paenibacillus polymyxa]|uniref:tyrosine-type recombinase/integrase n=1 Tax=Paenibacillus polymyxa TaxID=1406 RepID=UPI002024A6CD|nr:tyrosine-type recombinase/integrase [Paenibacillus polymyxa]URJ36550.1 tyrosine-type recombinase/integrase [Paenibacillus polymyxa]